MVSMPGLFLSSQIYETTTIPLLNSLLLTLFMYVSVWKVNIQNY